GRARLVVRVGGQPDDDALEAVAGRQVQAVGQLVAVVRDHVTCRRTQRLVQLVRTQLLHAPIGRGQCLVAGGGRKGRDGEGGHATVLPTDLHLDRLATPQVGAEASAGRAAGRWRG